MELSSNKINDKFVSFEGIIGRRDYFLNWVYISSISTLIFIPLFSWLISNINNYSDLFNIGAVISTAPLLYKYLYFIPASVISLLMISNAIRRLNDINGEINNLCNFIFSVLIILNNFALVFPIRYCIAILGISFIAYIYLFFKEGKITSLMPYDYTKEFNWGAFLGTWIWGLFNNSYIPLLNFVLCYTPLSLYFQLYCGLKGNEWAYKNKRWNDVEKFNKSQEKQTLYWCLISFIIVPVFIFIMIASIATIIIATTGIQNESETNIPKVEKAVVKIASLYFESYKIEEKENKFYITSSNWKKYRISDKKEILDTAAGIAAIKRRRDNIDTDKQKELPRTKIYSAENSQLLGEYIVNQEELNKKMSNTEKNNKIEKLAILVEESMSAYKFYNVE